MSFNQVPIDFLILLHRYMLIGNRILNNTGMKEVATLAGMVLIMER